MRFVSFETAANGFRLSDVHPHPAARWGKVVVMPPFPVEKINIEMWWWWCVERFLWCGLWFFLVRFFF